MNRAIHKVLLLLGAVAVAVPGSYGSSVLQWDRTWVDEVKLGWQPKLEEGADFTAVPSADWRPAFSFELNHSCNFTDGQRIYSGVNPFAVYDMEGNFREQLTIDGLPEMYRVTTDGTYFYGIVYERFGIYKIDMARHEVVGVISTPGVMYHICYVPGIDGGKGGFFTGDPGRGYFLSMDGTMLEGQINFTADMPGGTFCMGTAYMDGRIYVYASDNTYIREVYEYDAATLASTGAVFDLNDYAGQAGVGEGYSGRNIVPYTCPGNKRYLMLVDYNGLGFIGSSVPVGSKAADASVTGYNVYRNGARVNSAPLAKDAYFYNDSDLAEGMDYSYEIRPLTSTGELPSISGGKVRLDATDYMPLVEDFGGQVFTDFHASSRLYNYWTVEKDEDSSLAWVISNSPVGKGKCLQYQHAKDSEYGQSFVSKMMKADAGSNVMFSISYTGNTYAYNVVKDEKMAVQVTTDNGLTWQEAGVIAYKSDAMNFSEIAYDLSSLVGGKQFRVRLNPVGMTTEAYNWQFGEIKVWQYKPVSISGNVKFAGVPVDSELDIKMVLQDVGTTYEAKSDDSGRFSVENIGTGTYDVAISNGNYTYEHHGLEVREGGSYEIDIPGAKFATSAGALECSVGTDGIKKLSVGFENSGSRRGTPYVSVSFGGDDAGEAVGDSSLDVTPAYEVAGNVVFAETNVAGPTFFFDCSLYAKTNNYQSVQLNRYSKAGVLLETITLEMGDGMVSQPQGFFTSCGKVYAYTLPQAWMDPPVPACIIPVDMQGKKILYSQKIEVGDPSLTSVGAMCGNPVDGTFYVVDNSNGLSHIAADGSLIKKYELPSTGYKGLAFDSFSAGGPYLWMLRSDYTSGLVLTQYELASEQFTVNTHKVNDDSESAFNSIGGMATIAGSELHVSTGFVPGFYTLLAYQNVTSRNGQGKRQVLAYKMFPIETWIDASSRDEMVEAGSQGFIDITIDSSSLSDKDVKEAAIVLSTDGFGESVEIPLKLSVDADLNGMYPSPADFKASVDNDYRVNLQWRQLQSDVAVDYYRVLRDGAEIGRTEAVGMVDYQPLFGSQEYQIETYYMDGNIARSESVGIEVRDPQWGVGVEGLEAKVVTRRNVKLDWTTTPVFKNAFFDDFEHYTPFIINGIGDWTLVDGDRAYTYGHNNVDYDNEQARMAGIIYNPALTTPADDGVADNGSRQFFCFISGNLETEYNDDWLITPSLELPANSVVRFDVCARSSSYKELFRVGYSMSDSGNDDFQWLTTAPIEAPITWSTYQFPLPQEARRVAIHYESINSYMLFFDNIYVGPQGGYAKVEGYNVYRDGEKLNVDIIDGGTYMDYGLEDGEYLYRVETLYDNEATAESRDIAVEINTSDMANAPRDLSLSSDDGDVTLSWRAPVLAAEEHLRYDNGQPFNSIGGSTGTYVGIKWDSKQLKEYVGYSIAGIRFHMADIAEYLTPLVYCDGELLYTGEDIIPVMDRWNDCVFDHPVKIEEGHSYMVGYFVAMEPDSYPVSHDKGPGKAGYSDLYSADGKTWYSIYHATQGSGEYSINWNLAANLELLPDNTTTSEARHAKPMKRLKAVSLGSIPTHKSAIPAKAYASDNVDRFMGYNVYRDNEKLNQEVLQSLSYSDRPMSDAEYYVTAIYSASGEKASDKVFYAPVSLDKVEDGITVRFWPNPVRDILNVSGCFDNVSIHSLNGTEIYRNDIPGVALQIPMHGYQPGVYLLRITSGAEVGIHKVVVE